ncbi:hypothetical protein PENTCL1PPCAC_4707, partial [Pristionchus entomophagus]
VMVGGPFTVDLSKKGKVIAVAGCDSGVGLETALELYRRGAQVHMLCDSFEAAIAAMNEQMKEDLKKVQGNPDDPGLIALYQCKLSSFQLIRSSAANVMKAVSHIDALIVSNMDPGPNGGFTRTEDGHETTWQANHLGPVLLTELLLPLLEKSKEGRVVIATSKIYAESPKVDLTTIDTVMGYKNSQDAYAKSKLANVMYTRELARRLKQKGSKVAINCLDQDEKTSLYLAAEVKGVSGGYFVECKRAEESESARDDDACKNLYDYSLKAVGLA